MEHAYGIDFDSQVGVSSAYNCTVMPEIAEAVVSGGMGVEIWLENQRGHMRLGRIKNANSYAKVVSVMSSEMSLSAQEIEWINDNSTMMLKVIYPSGRFRMYYPLSFATQLPLEARMWVPGHADCYRLALDYFQRVHAIQLPVVVTPENYVMQSRSYQGQNLFVTNWQRSGFEQVMAPQVGDVIYMRFGGGAVEGPNHCGMLVSEGKILHHFINRLSTVQEFGGVWKDSAVMYLRHNSFL